MASVEPGYNSPSRVRESDWAFDGTPPPGNTATGFVQRPAIPPRPQPVASPSPLKTAAEYWAIVKLRSVMLKKNMVTRVSLMGGLIGALATNPRKALENEIDKANREGWNAIHIEPHITTNLFVWILQLLVLALTLGLFTWGGGYLVLFEREV